MREINGNLLVLRSPFLTVALDFLEYSVLHVSVSHQRYKYQVPIQGYLIQYREKIHLSMDGWMNGQMIKSMYQCRNEYQKIAGWAVLNLCIVLKWTKTTRHEIYIKRKSKHDPLANLKNETLTKFHQN
jgi:hypothetical protein